MNPPEQIPIPITPETMPKFPCWLYGSITHSWLYYERWYAGESRSIFGTAYTHHLPDQPDAPTVVPGVPVVAENATTAAPDWCEAAALHARTQQYLQAGGLFNPELMEGDKVRDLLLDIRDWLTRHAAPLEKKLVRARPEAETLHKCAGKSETLGKENAALQTLVARKDEAICVVGKFIFTENFKEHVSTKLNYLDGLLKDALALTPAGISDRIAELEKERESFRNDARTAADMLFNSESQLAAAQKELAEARALAVKAYPELLSLIKKIEAAHFRTTEDTGANPCALIVWNALRVEAGLPHIRTSDLPEWDAGRKEYIMPEDSKLRTALNASAPTTEKEGA